VIGATNYGNKLDPALVRPGRLGRVIEIRRPSAADLASIVRLHLGEDLAEMDLRLVGELAVGASGADAAGWVREARARARAAGRSITPSDLLAVVAPPETRSAAAMWRGSLHEAGHAVAMELLRVGRVEQVNVITRGTTGGVSRSTSSLDDPPTRGDLERVAVCLLAGRSAEVVFLGAASAGSGGAGHSDLAQATKLVAGIHGSAGLGDSVSYRGTGDELLMQLGLDPAFRKIVEKHLGELQAQAVRFVAEHRSTIEAVARRLVAKRVLGGDDLRLLLRRSCRRGRTRAANRAPIGLPPPSSRSSRP
jgi:ATP-dependent Zn protease